VTGDGFGVWEIHVHGVDANCGDENAEAVSGGGGRSAATPSMKTGRNRFSPEFWLLNSDF